VLFSECLAVDGGGKQMLRQRARREVVQLLLFSWNLGWCCNCKLMLFYSIANFALSRRTVLCSFFWISGSFFEMGH